MKIETEMYSVGKLLWKGLLEYKETNIRDGEVLIFPEEAKASILGINSDSVDLVLTYLLFFTRMSIKIEMKRLAPNAWVECELPEYKWKRFLKNLDEVLGKYLRDNEILAEEHS